MSEAEDIAFFRATAAATARTLPLPDALRFLRGALLVASEHDAMSEIRVAYVQLHSSDSQLELIASGQLKLNLGSDGTKPGGNGQ